MENNLGLIENNGKVVVSSRDIARVFEKQHAHVMRDIRQIVNDDPTWGLSNFGESSYLNEQRKEQPEFYLTRDGFTLLVMGYTGERAMEFKKRNHRRAHSESAVKEGQHTVCPD